MTTRTYPLVALVILDGWGLSEATEHNAVAQAATPVFDALWQRYPRTTLTTSGRAVGLPAGQMGNSEVGHLNLGAGRTVWQDISRIDNAIEDGSFFSNEALVAAFDAPRTHLIGLLSDGGVHSCDRHYLALLELAGRLGKQGDQVVVHAFTDGRDASPTGGRGYLADLLEACERTGAAVLGSVIGRYYAMDRDNREERTALALRALTDGEGEVVAEPLTAIEARYAAGQTDEFLTPIVVDGAPRIAPGDSVLFFNFRADRGRQMSRALEGAGARLTTFTEYHAEYGFPTAFPPEHLSGTLGQVVSGAGLRQLRIAETEKYAHVTYFFNGGAEEPLDGEERVIVPSPRVATYDLQPEMSAVAVTDRVCQRVAEGGLALLVLNYANPDMVGHTGSLPAATRAVETVDGCLGRVIEAVRAAGGAALVTADHGNCEQMVDPQTGGPHTAHTTNPVPLVLVWEDQVALSSGGALSAVAPTICDLLGLPTAPEMTAVSLLA